MNARRDRLRLGWLVVLAGVGCAGEIAGEPGGPAAGPSGPRDESRLPSTPARTGAGGNGGAALPGSTPEPGVVPPAPNAPDAKGCALPVARVWKLTPDQYTRTAQALLGTGIGRPGDELAATLPTRPIGFSNDATALELSEPHVAQLLATARRLAGAAAADAKVFPCQGARATEAACVRTFVEAFGARAFRRPLAPAEVQAFVGLFDKTAAQVDAAAAARQVLTAIFMSPSFLFRTELGVEGTAAGKPFTLTPFEKASALSYFLTDGPPDAALFEAARMNALETPAQLETHARRLLAGAATAPGVLKYLNEHFDTQQVRRAQKDAKAYPDWKSDLGNDLARESELFLQQVLWREDGKLSTLLTAPFSMLNPRLGAFYGVPAGMGTEFQKLPLPEHRVGLLMHGGIMASLARENDTDAVMRGKYVRELILCQHPPPPPPDVNAVPPPVDGKRTQRERLTQHSADPTCSGCHSLLDPLGLAFETFDGIGKHRTMDVGKPIDTSGTLTAAEPEGARWTTPVELAGLLARSPTASACFVAKTFEYAHGRASADTDACALAALTRRFEGTGGGIVDLLVGVVSHDSFYTRRAP